MKENSPGGNIPHGSGTKRSQSQRRKGRCSQISCCSAPLRDKYRDSGKSGKLPGNISEDGRGVGGWGSESETSQINQLTFTDAFSPRTRRGGGAEGPLKLINGSPCTCSERARCVLRGLKSSSIRQMKGGSLMAATHTHSNLSCGLIRTFNVIAVSEDKVR